MGHIRPDLFKNNTNAVYIRIYLVVTVRIGIRSRALRICTTRSIIFLMHNIQRQQCSPIDQCLSESIARLTLRYQGMKSHSLKYSSSKPD